MNLRFLALGVVAVAALGGTALAQTSAPTATVAQIGASPVPAPTVTSEAGRRGRRPKPSPSPEASETPEPPQFSNLDGTWEVQMQPLTGAPTIYSHFVMKQSGNDVSGTWERADLAKDPFTGSFDGRLFTLTVTQTAQGKIPAATYTMRGYIENFSDMVGLVTSNDPKDQGTPFTASHRKKAGNSTSIGPGIPGL